ncbi:FecR family protein [Chitinimonas sp. BJYL2]|uniref:FecR family protein n=1 Tax=Chitinimonas sp. BJYL2 TaxID=2976696 RepID=UPI0022B4928F|nr:FecR family protein [Chitinimonas sp. BJYL2]
MLRMLLLLSLACSSLVHAAIAGRIEAAGGEVARFDLHGDPQTTVVTSKVSVGDTLLTGAKGWMVVSMSDGASLTLRPNTRVRVDDYRYSADRPDDSRAWISLLTGALRSVTGLIGQSHKPAYRLATPTVTMGIRGTDHETVVIERSDDPDLPAGVYDTVHEGETLMRAGGAELTVRPGEAAFAAQGADARPGLLVRRPAVFERLRQFAQEHGIESVLNRLHERTDRGFRARPLSPEQRDSLLEQGRQALRERMESRQSERQEDGATGMMNPPPRAEQAEQAIRQRMQNRREQGKPVVPPRRRAN